MRCNQVNFLLAPTLLASDIGLKLAFDRYYIAVEKVYFGRIALINAYKRIQHDWWGEKLPEEQTLLMRKMFLEQAIEAYNKVRDYVILVLYFCFIDCQKLKDGSIRTYEDIDKIASSIRESHICQLQDDSRVREFMGKFKNYKNFTECVRTLANDLKHRGCRVVGMPALERVGTSFRVVDGEEINLSEIVEPRVIDIDVVTERLVDVHNESMGLLESLYAVCDFENKANIFVRGHTSE